MANEFDETRSFDLAEMPRLEPGTVLAKRYRLNQELGRGGMGIVFRATDLELQRDVAVKVVPRAASTPMAGERLLREARAAAALNHPGIVAVHDVGEHHAIPFFVMELVEGTSLHETRPSDLSEIVRIAVKICDALEHAHTHGIVHRDLKPENILLTGRAESRELKIADLGVAAHAHAANRITHSGAIVGTVSYMAPEQALGEAVDGRADLYALGVVLYELVTGKLPFTGARALEVVSQHVHAPVVPPRAIRPEIPAALDGVIVRLLAKDPAQRFATAAEAREAIGRSLSSGPAAGDGGAGANVAILEALSRGRLVGRADELAEARELWRRAREGAGHFLLISGEPGAGKTRLARELLIQAALDGALVFSGACYEYEAATPYLPFAEAFRKRVREDRDDAKLRATLGEGAARVAKLAPEIEDRLGPFPERAPLAPHEEKLLFADAVAGVLSEAGRARGVLFYVDDLHWADGSSLWLLGRLLRSLKTAPVLFVASYREIELDRAHPLSAALVEWNRERLTTRLALKRFAPAQTREQLSVLLGESVPQDFSDAVHRETEGNPFFVEEVLKSLIDAGAVKREGGAWTRCQVEDLAIPQSVKAAIGHRLDRVPAECSDVLRSAAVLGKTFEFGELLSVAGDRGEDVLLDCVDTAVAAQLLVAGRNDSFAFTHDKIREVLYEELNPIRRRRLHLRTAEGLERLASKRAVPAEKLAHHFIEAAEYERGLRWAKQAALDAMALYAYDEAIGAYRRALECAQVLGSTGEQLELEEAAGNAFVTSGNIAEALGHFERALELTRDPTTRARLQLQAATSLVTKGDARGLDAVRRALEVLDPVTHPVETANAIMIEGRFHHLRGQHRKAAELFEKAHVLLASPADGAPLTRLHKVTIMQLLAYTAGAYQHLGLFTESDVWARRAIEFGQAQAMPAAVAVGWEFIGESAYSTGAWREALGYAETEREIAARIHSRERLAWTYVVTGLSRSCLEDWARADEDLAAGIGIAESIGERRASLLMSVYRPITRFELGDVEGAERIAASAVAQATEAQLLFMRTEGLRAIAHMRVRQRRFDEAVKLFEEVLALTEPTDARVSRLWIGPAHVETLLALGRRDEARARFDAYAAMVAQCQSPHFAREVERLRAVLGSS